MNSKNTIFAFAFVCALSFSLFAEKAQKGFSAEQAGGASYDPLGLILDTKVFYKIPFVKKNGPLWETTRLELGVQNEWTPADNLLSVRATFEPIGFFDVCAKAGFFFMYTGLGYGCFRMESPMNTYDPKNQEHEKTTVARGYWLSMTPTLKAKVGRVIVLNSATINRVSIDGQKYFLEVRSYLPHGVKDMDLINNAYLLYECSGSVIVGITMKSEFVVDASVQSQRLCAMTVLKSAILPLKSSFCAIQAGLYLDDPLFAHQIFLGCLAGKEFRL